jgi:hypothetical protein
MIIIMKLPRLCDVMDADCEAGITVSRCAAKYGEYVLTAAAVCRLTIRVRVGHQPQ